MVNREDRELFFEEIVESDIPELTEIMTRAFDGEARKYEGKERGGPPGYDNGDFFRKWLFGCSETEGGKAILDGRIVAAYIVWILPDGHNILGNVFVDPDFQDRGLGTRIWRHIEAKYPATKSWRLETPEWAVKNRHFYEVKCGFRRTIADSAAGNPERRFKYRKEMHSGE
jgi:GNAT superfamily N-acetyltransferase